MLSIIDGIKMQIGEFLASFIIFITLVTIMIVIVALSHFIYYNYDKLKSLLIKWRKSK